MFTRPELEAVKKRFTSDPHGVSQDTQLFEQLIAQAEYGLDCAALLEQAVHHPAEPYGEAAALVTTLTNGFNEIWNRHHYGPK